MVRAFAAHLRAVADSEDYMVSDAVGAEDVGEDRGGALANVLEGLWQYYEQVSCSWSYYTMYIFIGKRNSRYQVTIEIPSSL